MVGKSKEDTNIPYLWFWKGKPAEKHLKDGLAMAPPVLSRSGTGRGGQRRPRLSVPQGLAIRRRPDAGANLYRNATGPGFLSGENVDRLPRAGRDLQCRPRPIPRRSPPPCCPPPPRLPVLDPHPGRNIDRQPRASLRDTTYPARFHRMGPRGRPLSRQEYPGLFPSRSRHREFDLDGRRRTPFMFPRPDYYAEDDDDCYEVESDDDSATDYEDSDLELYTRRDPSYPTRFRTNPFRYGERRMSHSDDDSVLTAFASEELGGVEGRRHLGRRFNLDPMAGRPTGRLPLQADYSPDFPRFRTSSSESRRNWYISR